ncbi:MAG: class I SAM-dependent methyltransferase, partial [Epsilonproteobacteria bacterium]|nr:class I SAM-dependent methyltransferase [Campylobacterota bacterium]
MNIKERLQNENLTLPSNFFSNIQHFKENLFKWNKIHNLSGARDEATMDDFIVDAVLPIAFLPPVNSLLDIGTGAGFPGLILAIALPNTQVTLVEPIAKRASFLQYNAVSMGLKNVTVVKK